MKGNKKIYFFTFFIAASSMLTASCNSSKIANLPLSIRDFANKAPSTQPKTSQTASAPQECVPSGEGKAVSWKQQVQSIALNTAITFAVKKTTGVEDAFLIQDEITDTCVADKYLQYAEKASFHLTDISLDVVENLAASIKTTKQKKHIMAEMHAAHQILDEGDQQEAAIKIADATELFQKALDENAAIDKAKFAAAMADSKKICVRDVEFISLANHIFDFAKENPNWAINNYKKNSVLVKFASSSANQITALGKITQRGYLEVFDDHDKKLLKKVEKRKNTKLDLKIVDQEGLNKDAERAFGV